MEEKYMTVQEIVELLNSNSTLKRLVIEKLGLKGDMAKQKMEKKEQELIEVIEKIEKNI